jgi:hypothetical protein
MYVFTVISLTVFPPVPLILEAQQNQGHLRFMDYVVAVVSFALGTACARVLWYVRTQLTNSHPVEFTD